MCRNTFNEANEPDDCRSKSAKRSKEVSPQVSQAKHWECLKIRTSRRVLRVADNLDDRSAVIFFRSLPSFDLKKDDLKVDPSTPWLNLLSHHPAMHATEKCRVNANTSTASHQTKQNFLHSGSFTSADLMAFLLQESLSSSRRLWKGGEK